MDDLLEELQTWKEENSGASPPEGSALLQKIRNLKSGSDYGKTLEASCKEAFQAAMPGIWGDLRAVKVEQDAAGGSQTMTTTERLCQDLRVYLDKNSGFYPDQRGLAPEERNLAKKVLRLKRESLSEEDQARFNDLPGWSWVAAERRKRRKPEAQEPPTAQEAQEVQEAREAQEAQVAQQPTAWVGELPSGLDSIRLLAHASQRRAPSPPPPF